MYTAETLVYTLESVKNKRKTILNISETKDAEKVGVHGRLEC